MIIIKEKNVFKKHQNFIISYRKYNFESSTRKWLHVPLLQVLSISYKISNQKTVQLISYKTFAHRGWRDGPRDKFLIVQVSTSKLKVPEPTWLSIQKSVKENLPEHSDFSDMSYLSMIIALNRETLCQYSVYSSWKKILKTNPEPQHRLVHISACTCLQENPHTWKQRCMHA